MNEKHPKKIKGIDLTNEQLAKSLGDLSYDQLVDILDKLSTKLNEDGLKDYEGNRTKLASHLWESAKTIKQASVQLNKAWEICKPFMK